MGRVTTGCAIAAILAAGTGAAAADDLGLRKGVYLGLHNEINWSIADAIDASGYAVPTGEETGVNDRAAAGGVHVGIDEEFGDVFFGVVLDMSVAGNQGRAASAAAPDLFYTNDINWYGTFRVRGGANFDPVRLYLTAGVAVAGLEAELFDGAVAPTPTLIGASRQSEQPGYVVGAGAEWDIFDHFALGLEYLYVNLNPIEFSPIASDSVTYNFKQDIDMHIARLNFSYRF